MNIKEWTKQTNPDDKEEVHVSRNSFCGHSPTGKHKWKYREDRYVCEHCGQLTIEQVLVD